MGINRIAVFCFTLFFLFLAVPSYAENKKLNFEVSRHKNFTRVYTHGTVVYGHEFGVIMHVNKCNENLLWITLSSYDKDAIKLEGKKLELILELNGKSVPLTTQVNFVNKITPLLNQIYILNQPITKDFLKLLESNSKIKVKVTGPKSELSKFDLLEETFLLSDLSMSLKKGKEICVSSNLHMQH